MKRGRPGSSTRSKRSEAGGGKGEKGEKGYLLSRKGEEPMGGLMTAGDVFEKAREAALAATAPDERALQIDYAGLKTQIEAALGDRKVAMAHINRFLPEGYEAQGRLNLVLLTAGQVVYDIVIGDSYFRYDGVSVSDLD